MVRITELTNNVLLSSQAILWDGLTQAELRSSNGATVVRRYFPQGMAVVSGTTNTPFYATYDHLGSARELVNTNGTVVSRYAYSEWGERSNVVTTVTNDFGFTGHRHHLRTGLVLAPFRVYHPGLGRWLSRDPIAENGGINLYQYVGNNPVNYIDPNGLWGVKFGGFGNIGIGDPTLIFDNSSWGDLGQGAAASFDGFLPGVDPLGDWFDLYDPCDKTLQRSQALAGLSRDILTLTVGGPLGQLVKSSGQTPNLAQKIFLAEFSPSWTTLVTSKNPLSPGNLAVDWAVKQYGRYDTYKKFKD